jgi:DNA gyrase inhibitor GyrI
VILEDKEQQQALAVFQESLSQLDKEIEALGTVRDILTVFVSQLEKSVGRRVRFEFLEDSQLLKVIGTLSPPKTNLKEEWSMEDLNKVSKVLESDMNIRVVYLPPATVASSMYYGEQPEDTSGQRLFSFIKSVNLPEIKPDFRVYGFNNPNPQQGEAVYGYEFWVTIPEDMEVTEPLQKKEFAGGLYAALCINMGDFQKWGEFFEQIKADEEYEIDWREPGGMGGCMEEELNAFTMAVEGTTEVKQLDLLIPIKKKE